MKIYLDFETFSDVEIKLGARAYVAGKRFRPVSLAWAIDGGRISSTTDFSKIPDAIAQALLKGGVLTAHNAPFDVAVFNRVFKTKIREFRDTAALCRYYSIPASLDGAAVFFGLGQKEAQGKTLLKKMRHGEDLDRAEMRELLSYNRHDVKLLRMLDRILTRAGEPDAFTFGIMALHEQMNRSGIAVDLSRAGKLLEAIKEEKARTETQAKKAFGVFGKESKAVATSADQVKKFLGSRGFPVPSIAEKDLEDFLSEAGSKLPKACAELIPFYRELQSRGADKLEKIVRLTRIYDSSIFHGAHTGRPTGGGINLLNVKRYSDGDDETPFEKSLKRIRKTAVRGGRVKRLSSLLWGCLIPESGEVVVRSDLSAIEPRVGAWLRGDAAVLDIYHKADDGTGKDEYTIFGDSMGFPKAISRPLSKIVILAACYGMQAERFRVQCRGFGVPDPGEAGAKKILDGYHARNPSVKRVWFDLIKSAVLAIENGFEGRAYGGRVWFHGVTIDGKPFLRVGLPSGRVKHYADVRIETRGSNGWKTFSYTDPVKGFRQTVPAAGLYENLVQAIAVDVSFHKAAKIQKFADVKLIIHDELNISTDPGKVDRIKKEMKSPVPWLPGMPVSSKTAVCSSFHKGDTI